MALDKRGIVLGEGTTALWMDNYIVKGMEVTKQASEEIRCGFETQGRCQRSTKQGYQFSRQLANVYLLRIKIQMSSTNTVSVTRIPATTPSYPTLSE